MPYNYRGEFYKCELKIIKDVFNETIELMTKYNKDCNCNKECVTKMKENDNKIKNKNQSKKMSKKANRKASRKISKKLSKKISKKVNKNNK